MGLIKRVPTIVTHEIAAAGLCNGSLPNGVDSEETLFRGRYRIWKQCSVAGKLEFAPELLSGFAVYRVSAVSTGPTAFDAYLIDPDSVAFHMGTLPSGNGFIDFGSKPVVVPPTFSFVVKLTVGVITADSRVMFGLGEKWGQPAFSQDSVLGREERPPGMERA